MTGESNIGGLTYDVADLREHLSRKLSTADIRAFSHHHQSLATEYFIIIQHISDSIMKVWL